MCVINNKIDRRLHSGRFGQSSTDEHTAQVLEYSSTRVLEYGTRVLEYWVPRYLGTRVLEYSSTWSELRPGSQPPQADPG